MIVDFHVHSTASDGTLDPQDVAYRAKAFAAVALTDHDNTDGLAEFAEAGAELVESGRSDASFVTGLELSIEPGDGFDQFHLLALGIDPENAELKKLLGRVLAGRNERNKRIIAAFSRLGIEMDMDGLAACAHGEILARPHFARWLVERGYEKDIPSAFARYLLPDSPAATRCYEERFHPPQEDVFRAVHSAGGLCIMAHPKYWRREWKRSGCDFAAAEREISRLKEAGLDGLEALYQANTPEENERFTRIAMKASLLTTAGSDFHGSNKPDIELGMEVDEMFIAPLFERLKIGVK